MTDTQRLTVFAPDLLPGISFDLLRGAFISGLGALDIKQRRLRDWRQSARCGHNGEQFACLEAVIQNESQRQDCNGNMA